MMNPYWENTDPTVRLADRREAQPPVETTFAAAQEAVNFVVFRPEWLPADCAMTEVTLRPEQAPGRPGGVQAQEIGQTPWTEANPGSVRAVFRGRQRRLRLKQFLYDWAPPAASTAPLWNSPHLTPVPGQNAIAWLGIDYLKRPGGCIQLMRTQIEISVMEGEFTEDELGRLLLQLTPAVWEASRVVREAPFHRLNYWVRYQLRGVQVPYGLWRYHHPRRYDQSQPVSLDELVSKPPLRLLLPADSSYVFDSAVIIAGEESFHREIELIYRHQENMSDHLWIIAVDRDSEHTLPIPPEAETHRAAVRQTQTLRDTAIWYAALSEQYGAWEAFWEEEKVRYAVWAGTSPFQNSEQFKTLVENLRVA
jgi:hypothetical protein